MKIKVCGMRNSGNISELLTLDPDYIGLIFYPESKRFAGNLDTPFITSISSAVKKTGIFVNEEFNKIENIVEQYGLHAIQLHGDESSELCERLKTKNREVVKAFGVDENFDFEVLNEYEDQVDFFLFDTKTGNYGGSGKSFNWAVLDGYKLTKPYFLSGGLSLENIEAVTRIKDERLYAVDLNSRFEIEPGLKDIEKLKRAFEIVRN